MRFVEYAEAGLLEHRCFVAATPFPFPFAATTTSRRLCPAAIFRPRQPRDTAWIRRAAAPSVFLFLRAFSLPSLPLSSAWSFSASSRPLGVGLGPCCRWLFPAPQDGRMPLVLLLVRGLRRACFGLVGEKAALL